MTHAELIRKIASVVLNALVDHGGTVDFSHFYGNEGSVEQHLMSLIAGCEHAESCGGFWFVDAAIGLLEESGTVRTEPLSTELMDGNCDYRISLVGEPLVPTFDLPGGCVTVDTLPLPSGFRSG